ncbi:hypothetical protein AZ09_11085 [Acetobacter aceti 1023]|nr:hypothetical protein AZ09_11085 [Acetobacter aceti 1023]
MGDQRAAVLSPLYLIFRFGSCSLTVLVNIFILALQQSRALLRRGLLRDYAASIKKEAAAREQMTAYTVQNSLLHCRYDIDTKYIVLRIMK